MYQSREAKVASDGGSIHEFRKSTRKMRWWYELLADYMITNPGASQGELAAHFGRAESTISTVINTDAFKAYYRQRRTHHSEKLDATVRNKLFAATNKSLDHILDVLDKKRDTIPLEMLQRVADSSLKSLGYGVTPPSGVTVNVDNIAPNPSTLPSRSTTWNERVRRSGARNSLPRPSTTTRPVCGQHHKFGPRSGNPQGL